MRSNENLTDDVGNWTDGLDPVGDEYASGTEMFVYDLSIHTEEDGGHFGLFDFDAYSSDEPAPIPTVEPQSLVTIGSKAGNNHSLDRSEPHNPSNPATPQSVGSGGRNEHLSNKSEVMDDTGSLHSDIHNSDELLFSQSEERQEEAGSVTHLHYFITSHPNIFSSLDINRKTFRPIWKYIIHTDCFETTPNIIFSAITSLLIIHLYSLPSNPPAATYLLLSFSISLIFSPSPPLSYSRHPPPSPLL